MKVKNVTIIRLSCSTGLIRLLITSSSCGLQPNGWPWVSSTALMAGRFPGHTGNPVLVAYLHCCHWEWYRDKEQPSACPTMGTCGGYGAWGAPRDVPPYSCASTSALGRG